MCHRQGCSAVRLLLKAVLISTTFTQMAWFSDSAMPTRDDLNFAVGGDCW